MAGEWASWIAPGLFLALLAAAAVSDLARRKIPNWTVIALVVVWIGATIAGQVPGVWYINLAMALIAFAVGYGIYHFGVMGAGDVKLFAAGALFMGGGLGLMWFFVATALFGGVLAIVYLLLRPRKALRGLTTKGREEAAANNTGTPGIPYGISIALAAALTCYVNEFARF